MLLGEPRFPRTMPRAMSTLTTVRDFVAIDSLGPIDPLTISETSHVLLAVDHLLQFAMCFATANAVTMSVTSMLKGN